jgi:hypothetical protein
MFVPLVFAFLLPLIESAATTIGAGIMVGTFGGATAGVILRRSRREVEAKALRDGYFGAAAAVAVWILEGRNV